MPGTYVVYKDPMGRDDVGDVVVQGAIDGMRETKWDAGERGWTRT